MPNQPGRPSSASSRISGATENLSQIKRKLVPKAEPKARGETQTCMYFIVASTKSSTGMPHHLPVHMLALKLRHTTSRYFLCANHRMEFGDTSNAEPAPAAAAVTTDVIAPLPPPVWSEGGSLPVGPAPGMFTLPETLLLLLFRKSRVVAARPDPAGGGV